MAEGAATSVAELMATGSGRRIPLGRTGLRLFFGLFFGLFFDLLFNLLFRGDWRRIWCFTRICVEGQLINELARDSKDGHRQAFDIDLASLDTMDEELAAAALQEAVEDDKDEAQANNCAQDR
ncbi:uncharacterized protein N7498_001372 [Penicillium cinerascens]|uniref:Uncharacterized protein n=1 Tax=Penicillium cinerascens TaxID=70096 RepID=A0A9W9TE33_9EURO|nr:uncharacterized protein N7498_001372 [Penicillium cinerascens]KAJ5219273.1 hypothetical protein N7498_001372 [Penicillium cinerascens]